MRETAGGEYEVKVKLPGGFACFWDEPSPVEAGHRFGSLPAVCSLHGRATGLVSGTGDVNLAPGGFSQPRGVPRPLRRPYIAAQPKQKINCCRGAPTARGVDFSYR